MSKIRIWSHVTGLSPNTNFFRERFLLSRSIPPMLTHCDKPLEAEQAITNALRELFGDTERNLDGGYANLIWGMDDRLWDNKERGGNNG
jgi:hypothetical protein